MSKLQLSEKSILLHVSILFATAPMLAFAQQTNVISSGDLTVLSAALSSDTHSELDYENAIPMALPINYFPSSMSADADSLPKTSGSRSGSRGQDGAKVTHVPVESISSESAAEIAPSEFGTQNHPYSTSRVDTDPSKYKASRTYPYSPTGKLYFKIGASTYVCSASLVKPGVLVTAAHCVASFGASTFYSDFEFHPAKYNGTTLTGTWNADSVSVKTSYFNGTESCAVSGVVCPNDVATIKLAGRKSNTDYPGHTIGWYGYGWGFYSFSDTPMGLKGAHISQLGYPVSHDSGLKMQRNDSFGYKDTSLSNNVVIGSRMTGGSSGGPWLVNLGTKASGASLGSKAKFNVVVGVTSWGYVSSGPKQQGASPFTTSNIKTLVNYYCPKGAVDKHCVN